MPGMTQNWDGKQSISLAPLQGVQSGITQLLTFLSALFSVSGYNVQFAEVFDVQPLNAQITSTDTSITLTFLPTRPWVEVFDFAAVHVDIVSVVIEAEQITVNLQDLPPITIPVQS